MNFRCSLSRCSIFAYLMNQPIHELLVVQLAGLLLAASQDDQRPAKVLPSSQNKRFGRDSKLACITKQIGTRSHPLPSWFSKDLKKQKAPVHVSLTHPSQELNQPNSSHLAGSSTPRHLAEDLLLVGIDTEILEESESCNTAAVALHGLHLGYSKTSRTRKPNKYKRKKAHPS